MQFPFSLLAAAPPPVSASAQQKRLGAGFTLTADVQRLVNPGCNVDRGPASFHALRLHGES